MRSAINLFTLSVLLFCISGCVCPQRVSPGQKAKSAVPFTFSPKDFGEIEVVNVASEKAPGTDEPRMPSDAPAYRCYTLKRKAPLPAIEKEPRYFFPAYNVICLAPTFDPSVDNFAKAYPSFSGAIEKVKKLLKTRSVEFKQFDDLFDFPHNNAGWSITAKRQYFEFPKLAGVFFLVQYSQDMTPTPLNNEELTADFQGLTKDQRYYIGARFSITHPGLPKGIDFVDDSAPNKCLAFRYPAINDCVRGYLRVEDDKLEKLSDQDFQPSIGTIKNLLASIDPQ